MPSNWNYRVVLVFVFVGIQAIVGLQLKLLNVVFRHGDRTPLGTDEEIFPTSPYINETFYPYGHGQLTNRGKQRVYDLGVRIRQQYNEFLGAIYHPKMIRARSSDRDRTKMSLQLAMAGAFAPSPPQQWNLNLNWQPVVMNYVPYPDALVMPTDCPLFLVELEKTRRLPEIQEEESQYNELMRNLTEWTGKPMRNTGDVAGLYSSLKALQFMGLELPEWTEEIFPEGLISQAAVFHYRLGSFTKRLKRLNGGIMLKYFADSMSSVISGKEPDLKMNIFGAHDYNIHSLLDIFDYKEPYGPQYSSAIFVELLEDDDHKYYVRVYYYKGIPAERVPVNIPDCGELCPFDKFINLFSDIFPNPGDMECLTNKSTEIF